MHRLKISLKIGVCRSNHILLSDIEARFFVNDKMLRSEEDFTISGDLEQISVTLFNFISIYKESNGFKDKDVEISISFTPFENRGEYSYEELSVDEKRIFLEHFASIDNLRPPKEDKGALH